MSIISIPFTFSPGGTIISSQVNSCLSTIYNDYNGNIGNSNLSNSLVITDSKLAQITSASKVSATAITNCSSLPSGSGVWPTANLPSQFASSVVLSATVTATQSLTSNTWTQRTFGTTLEDSGGYFSSNTYTPLVAGWYLVSYMDSILSSGGTGDMQISIYKNGAAYVSTHVYNQNTTTSGLCASAIIQMNGSTDYIQFYDYSLNTATAQGATFCFASAVRVF